MIRSFNYTGRTRIKQSQIQITLRTLPDDRRTFEFNADLAGLDLPPDSPVCVEAYHRQSMSRFQCGTVGNLTPPFRPDLSNITSERVLFRVKVLASGDLDGRILAVADRVRPFIEDASEQKSILPVEPVDLGDQVWRLQFDEDDVVLQVNEGVPDVMRWVSTDPLFTSLVFPAVLHGILTQILLVERYPEAEEGHWTGRWLEYGKALLREPVPDEEDGRVDWIDEVVKNFAAKFRVQSLLTERLRAEDS